MPAIAASPRLVPEGFSIQPLTLALCTISINVLALAVPIVTLQVYDRILRNQSYETLQVLLVGVGIAIILDVTLRIARAYLLGVNGADYVHRMSVSALDHVVNTQTRGATNDNVAEGLSRISAIRSMRDFYNGHSLTVIIDLCFVPIYLAVIWYVGGSLVLVPLAVVVAFAIMSGLMGFELKRQLLIRKELDDKRYDFLIRTLNAIHSVKAFAAEYLQLRNYETFHDRSCQANHRLSMIATRSFNNAALYSQMMTAYVIAVGAYAAVNGSITIGTLIAVSLISGRIMQPIQRGLVLWVQYQDFDLAEEKVTQIFQRPRVQFQAAERQPENTGYLEAKNISFRFDGGTSNVLDGVDLTLHRGDAIRISGAPGSGKSTLLKVIAGIYQPTGGEIIIDDVNLKDVTPERIQRNIGYLSHSSTIFRGTIRDNLTRFGAVPFAEALEVIASLGMKQEFSALPHGFDTRLTGTISDPISPGVKQMVTLLRALISKPRIILFDNADMCLDRVSYQRLYRILAAIKPHTSIVIIGDDQNFVSLADQHFILADGKLTERQAPSSPLLAIINGGVK